MQRRGTSGELYIEGEHIAAIECMKDAAIALGNSGARGVVVIGGGGEIAMSRKVVVAAMIGMAREEMRGIEHLAKELEVERDRKGKGRNKGSRRKYPIKKRR